MPFDGDPRAAYAIAEWNGSNWNLENCRVAYDYLGSAQAIRQTEMPQKEHWAMLVETARWKSLEE